MQRLFPVFILALILAGDPSAFAADPSLPRDVVPFKLHRGHMIVVKCSVGSLRDVTAIVDTGASETVVDMEVVKKLSLATQPGRATFITQQAKVWAVLIPDLQLGPVGVDRLEGIATDLSSLTVEIGIRPQVLIGMDVLRRSSFMIDYRSHRLVFGPTPRLAHSAPLVGTGSRFVVIESTILGHGLRLQVDSGFEGVLLYQGRVPGLEHVAFRDGDVRIASVAQDVNAHSFDSPEMQIGDWRTAHSQLTVTEGLPSGLEEFDGLIGTAFLSRHRVALDFERAMIYWD